MIRDRRSGLAERVDHALDQTTETLFLIAFFLFTYKLFWSVVRDFSLFALEIILSWPKLVRLLVGLPLIALPVLVAGYLLFGDEERPGWLVLAQLRKHPVVARGLGYVRRAGGILAGFAFLKMVWLSGDKGAGSIDWWHLFGELLKRF